MTYHNDVKQRLDDIVASVTANKDKYVKDPERDFIRNRKLPLDKTIKLTLSMKGGSLNKELYEFFGRDPEAIVTSSAFIQQRDKLTPELFEYLFREFTARIDNLETYKGYRLLAVDGSDINVAYDKDAETYVKPSIQIKKDGTEGRGHNQIHLNAIYDVQNKIYVDALLQPKQKVDERRAFINMLNNMQLDEKAIFICDRGYPSMNLLTHFKYKENADYLMRVKNNEMVFFRDLPMEELDITKNIIVSTNQYDRGKENYVIVQNLKGTQKNRVYKKDLKEKPRQWDFADKETLSIRIVRFKITDTTYETIFTSLPRDLFSIEEIKKLYAMRWGIETSFRELKYVIGLSALHSKKDAFVKQEIFAKLLMYNFSECIIAQEVIEQDENRKHSYQVNYTMAMKICLDFFRGLVDPDNVYKLISKYIEALRPNRKDKRKQGIPAKMFIWFVYRVPA